MSSSKQITIKRLQKQQIGFQKDPIPNVWVKRDGFLNFYFCLHGLDQPYKGGYYYGLLQLHQNYPFAAPKLFMYTKSGRFQINMSICTSFTHYHQQSWTSAWNVRSLLIATISFMTSQQPSYGCRNDPTSIRKKLAEISLTENLKIGKFKELFSEQLKMIDVKLCDQIINSQQVGDIQTSELQENDKNYEQNEQRQQEIERNVNIELEDDLLPRQQNNVNQRAQQIRGRRKKLIITSLLVGIAVTVTISCYLIAT